VKDGLRVLAIVPARGGTDPVPYLNIKRLGDCPLLAHTLQAARAASCVDRLVVSTDDPQVAEVARAWGGEAPFLRPAGLAGDIPSLKPVIAHAVREMEAQGEKADLVVVLQATAPFRDGAAIDGAVERLVAGGYDTVLSVTEDRTLSWRAEGGRLLPLFAKEGRREEQPPVYKENGAVVAMRRSVLEGEGRCWTPRAASATRSASWCWTGAPASPCTTSRTSGWPSGSSTSPASCSGWTGARRWAWGTSTARWPSPTPCARSAAPRWRS
jgi:N-acylneuraminate cytidylyltransferase